MGTFPRASTWGVSFWSGDPLSSEVAREPATLPPCCRDLFSRPFKVHPPGLQQRLNLPLNWWQHSEWLLRIPGNHSHPNTEKVLRPLCTSPGAGPQRGVPQQCPRSHMCFLLCSEGGSFRVPSVVGYQALTVDTHRPRGWPPPAAFPESPPSPEVSTQSVPREPLEAVRTSS